MNPRTLRGIQDENALEAVLGADLAVIYKHSPLCGLSASAAREVRRFMGDHPRTPVYMLDVIRDRALCRTVEERLDVRHESPQVIVIRDGSVAWEASHRSVRAEALAQRAGA